MLGRRMFLAGTSILALVVTAPKAFARVAKATVRSTYNPTFVYNTILQTTPGALALWHLNEPSGTTFADSVGGFTATISGGVTLNQTGLCADGSKAAIFNGSTGSAALASSASLSLEFSDPFSIGALVSPAALGSANAEQFIICKQENSSNFRGWAFGLVNSGGSLKVIIYLQNTTSNFIKIIGSIAVSLNTAHRVKISYDGTHLASGVNLWVDGVWDSAPTVSSDTLGANTIVNAVAATLGSRGGSANFFNGTIQYIEMQGVAGTNGVGSTHNAYHMGTPYDNLDPFLYNVGIQGRTQALVDPIIPNVIIDTDLCVDVDDALDIYMLCVLHAQKKIKIIGVVTTSSDLYSASCAKAILDYFSITASVYAYQGAGQYRVQPRPT